MIPSINMTPLKPPTCLLPTLPEEVNEQQTTLSTPQPAQSTLENASEVPWPSQMNSEAGNNSSLTCNTASSRCSSALSQQIRSATSNTSASPQEQCLPTTQQIPFTASQLSAIPSVALSGILPLRMSSPSPPTPSPAESLTVNSPNRHGYSPRCSPVLPKMLDPTKPPFLASTSCNPSLNMGNFTNFNPLKSILRPVGFEKPQRGNVSFSTNPVTSTKFFVVVEPPSVMYSEHPGGESLCTFTLFRPDYCPVFLPSMAAKPVSAGAVALFDTTLKGYVLVQNLSFHKLITVRYSFDMWASFSDTIAVYHSSPQPPSPSGAPGMDKFCFQIDVKNNFEQFLTKRNEEQTNGRFFGKDRIIMHFAVRYEVDGHVYWDNNDGRNHQIHFIKHSRERKNNHHPSYEGIAIPLGHQPLQSKDASPTSASPSPSSSPLSPLSSFRMSNGLSSRYSFSSTSNEPYVPTDFFTGGFASFSTQSPPPASWLSPNSIASPNTSASTSSRHAMIPASSTTSYGFQVPSVGDPPSPRASDAKQPVVTDAYSRYTGTIGNPYQRYHYVNTTSHNVSSRAHTKEQPAMMAFPPSYNGTYSPTSCSPISYSPLSCSPINGYSQQMDRKIFAA